MTQRARRVAVVVALGALAWLPAQTAQAASFTIEAYGVGEPVRVVGLQDHVLVGTDGSVGVLHLETYAFGTRECFPLYGGRWTYDDGRGNTLNGYIGGGGCRAVVDVPPIVVEEGDTPFVRTYELYLWGGTGLYAGAASAEPGTFQGTAGVEHLQLAFTTS